MSFSAATCITEVGPQPLGENIEIYSDVDNYTALVSAVTLTQLTTNCPLILEVPDGSTKLKVFDPETTCFYIIQLQSNDMCSVCDLGFTSFNSSSISRLTVGDLTGSCDSSITDYLINWYVNDELIFTSGKGTLFPYQQTHPMTGDSSIMVTEGLYTPVIQDVEINGFIFSKTGGTGHIPAKLQCFEGQSVFVTGFTCDNGTTSSDLPQYEHKISFVGKSSEGVIPPTASATYKLSADTKFFAWSFKGESVSDTIKLSLISSNYNVPIILEYWQIGGDVSSNDFTITSFPKKRQTTSFFDKVTTLTGLTISPGDYIQIDITPNPTNPQTNWTLYMDCLESFNCDYCDAELPWKISGSTITGITGNCDVINVNFCVSGGCSPTTGYTTLDLYKYHKNSVSFYYDYNPPYCSAVYSLYWSNTDCNRNWLWPYVNYSSRYQCATPSNNTITYEKTVGNFKVTSSNINDIALFRNSYNSYALPLVTVNSGDSTNIEYYRYFAITYPAAEGNTSCGDGVQTKEIKAHISSVVTTGQTGSDYYINFTMPTIVAGRSYVSCDIDCQSEQSYVVNTVNTYSTGSTYTSTIVNNKGSIYTYPIPLTEGMTQNTISQKSGELPLYSYINYVQLGTFPATATTNNPPVYTVLYNLSGVTCNNLNTYFPDVNYVNLTTYRYLFRYKVELINPLDVRDFKISSYTFTQNGEDNFPLIDVYVFSAGTVQYTNPTYII